MTSMNENKPYSSQSNYSDRPAAATGDRIADAAGQVGEAAQEQIDRLADAIRRKPVQAAGIAAGVGFLLALLARR